MPVSVVRFFQPPNRLAKAIATPGGKRVSEAVSDAVSGLESVSGACLERIDEALAAVRVATESADRASLYKHARDIAGLAAVCGKADLGAAALSLCTVLDRAADGGRLTPVRLQVYGDAMRTLRASDPPQEARRELLATLDAMTARLCA